MNNNKIIKIIIPFILLLLITIGLSFSYFTANVTGEETGTTITVTGGTMNIVYNSGANININHISPQSEVIGTKTFTVTGNNTTGLNMFYNISLEIVSNTFTTGALKYKLLSTNTGGNGTVVPSIAIMEDIPTGENNIILGNGIFTGPTGGNKVHTYNLELYFPNTGEKQNEDQGKEIKAYIKIENGNVTMPFNEDKGVNRPVLFTGMTPIKWDGTTEIETNEDDPNWYDYETKKWANAKTLDGSYWVWIPRYAYKITSGYHSSTTGTIDIKFLKGKTNQTLDDTPIESRGYIAGIKDTSMHYFSHPAFASGGETLGFWVAKFEPTVAEGVASGTETCDSSDNVTTKTLKIIPNAATWRCINISNAYTVSLNMKDKTGIYGWLTKEVNTHMMKNDEWGAVAYLSKSKYGAETEEVWNNAYNQYRTGCSGTGVNATNESTCVSYNTENGQKASTTHNIYGVYDMSGGAWERVMGNYNNLGASSGFTNQAVTEINNKYIIRYKTPTENLLNGIGMDYDSSVYGDGVYETSSNAYRYNGSSWEGTASGSWYGDVSYLPYTSAPWFGRGGYWYNGSYAGVFYFDNSYGNAHVSGSFRPVLCAAK